MAIEFVKRIGYILVLDPSLGSVVIKFAFEVRRNLAMKSKSALYVIFFVFCFFCFSEKTLPQKTTRPDTPHNNSDFFPTSVGTWWTYDVIRYVNFPRDSSVKSELTIRITSTDTLSNGLPVSRWQVTISDSELFGQIFPFGEDSVVYVGQAGDSVMLYRSTKDTTSRYMLLRFPLVVGQTWGMDDFTSFQSSLDSTGTISVPNGTFENCVQVGRHGGWWQASIGRLESLKESVGFIEIIHHQEGLINNKFTMKLKDYYIEPTFAGEQDGGVPTRAFILSQNYPNPFNPNTEVRFEIRGLGLVSLKIFDLLGKEIATLVNEELHAGIYHVSWNPVNQSGGVYFYWLRAGDFVEVKKLVYLK